jgi:hypothetical protein
LLSNLENIEDELNRKLEKAAREKEKMGEQLTEAREEAEGYKAKLRD